MAQQRMRTHTDYDYERLLELKRVIGKALTQKRAARQRAANIFLGLFALTLAGVLVTMWRNIDVVNQAEKVLRSGSFPVFQTVIRQTDRVDESTFQRQPLRVYSPRSAACVDYRALVQEYLERGKDCGQG